MRIVDREPVDVINRSEYLSGKASCLELEDIAPGHVHTARFIRNKEDPATFAGDYFVIVEGIERPKPRRPWRSASVNTLGYSVLLLPLEDEELDPHTNPAETWPIDPEGNLVIYKPWARAYIPLQIGYVLDAYTLEDFTSHEELAGNPEPIINPPTPVPA
jgi:hypothetical protein